ncbi:DUF3037 domain-containing protein [Lactobacillus sp. PSON]|uniref:DUF3037 domain-containing protein n=1 Tax=Lactobacillus sp. PSON TaxID=3455454 RepID=UPI004042D308
MHNTLYYTVLKYMPNIIRMESINVGLAVHYPKEKYSHFFKMTNINKIKAFDDEYNPDFFNMVMDSLSYELDYKPNTSSNINSDESRFLDITESCFLEKRTNYLANEFRFDKIQRLHTSINDYKNDIKQLIYIP